MTLTNLRSAAQGPAGCGPGGVIHVGLSDGRYIIWIIWYIILIGNLLISVDEQSNSGIPISFRR